MDACEAPRHEQAQPCPWPYTLASNCTETYAESVGRPYDVASLVGLVVDAVLLVILSRRALHALLDTEVLRGRRVRWCCGFARRTRSSLTSFDKAYLLMSFMLLVQCVLRLDLHGWRGVYNIRAYRSAQSVTIIVGNITGIVVIDHYVMASYMMVADVMTADVVSSSKRSFGHRLMKCFVLMDAVLCVAVQPAFFTMEEGVEDSWNEAAVYTLAQVVLVICMGYATRSVFVILAYLTAPEKKGGGPHFSSSSTVTSVRVANRKRSIRRTRSILLGGFLLVAILLVDAVIKAPKNFEDRRMSLWTPCGPFSLIFIPTTLMSFLCIMAVAFGPTRLSTTQHNRMGSSSITTGFAGRASRRSSGSEGDRGRRGAPVPSDFIRDLLASGKPPCRVAPAQLRTQASASETGPTLSATTAFGDRAHDAPAPRRSLEGVLKGPSVRKSSPIHDDAKGRVVPVASRSILPPLRNARLSSGTAHSSEDIGGLLLADDLRLSSLDSGSIS